MAYVVLVALACTAATYALSGAALLVTGRARLAGAVAVGSGALGIASATVEANGRPEAARILLLLAVLVGVLALTVYPRPWLSHPVDFLALATVVALPIAVVVRVPSDPGLAGFDGPGGVLLVAGSVLFLHTWWRIERSRGPERRALAWLALATGSALLVSGFLSFAFASSTPASVAATLAFAAVGPALYVGAGRTAVFDVRALVVRFVVLATALLGYLALFMTVSSFLELLGGRPPSTVSLAVVAAACATALHPFQVALRGVVDELLFGRRPDPLGAATHVADHISDDPVVALRTIREALVLPYARLTLDGTEVARSGAAVTDTRAVGLQVGDGHRGELEVGLRAGDLRLTAADERALHIVAPLLAQTLRARALAAEVQAARAGTVAALEEERRRLRRDLHDGLGPRLSGIAFTSDAVRNLLHDDPRAAESLLADLRAETAQAIGEIRQLVYGMRPPALDELGLVGALRQQVTALRTADGSGFRVRIDADQLPSLPAAVEVAAYRIAVEALTNAARHSGAESATAALLLRDGCLVVDVRDRGRTGESWRAGVGLASMRERAAELGGTLDAGGSPEGGHVRARLPLGG